MQNKNISDPLFHSKNNSRLDKSNFKRSIHWDIIRHIPGYTKPLRLHDLRHTYASISVASGASIKVLQSTLGHASAAMTLDVYSNLFDSELDQLRNSMNNFIRVADIMAYTDDR